ncbi:MarR family winged helix-turn-helix transcriptional regulator [Microbacterium sp. A84]|uniref:MarR family winged helix-turn-helix transcriptional regulator n=1 Tax=Microbacterium sp. A84 TaxID=3450715 RepID=UPI003F4257FE
MTESITRLTGSEALVGDMSFLLARASALSNAAGNAALADVGMKVRPYAVLELAAGEARTSQREIAEFLRLDPSQVVALVDDLQKSGLVTREPDTRDRRANVVIATPHGLETLTRARQAVRRAERDTHSQLTDTERVTLADLLRKTAFPA